MASTERNAVILAAGTSSRFVPLSAEIPKGLLEVRGEILIERQIRQLIEAGVTDITVVTGYKAGMFDYLKEKFGVRIVHNEDYAKYNNISSVIRVLDRLSDTFVCSSDNYFPENVFLGNPAQSYYSALYADGPTSEYCLGVNSSDDIVIVSVGGENSWYMIGHVYFSKDFSEAFKPMLLSEYENPTNRGSYWEDIYIKHLESLPKMKIHRYSSRDIEEFDSIDELRKFDSSYVGNTRSSVLRDIASRLGCLESDLDRFVPVKHEGDKLRFSFRCNGQEYGYDGLSDTIKRL